MADNKTPERWQAKKIICHEQLNKLSDKDRFSLLLGWWGIDSEDSEYHLVGPIVQRKLDTLEEPDNVASEHYNPLILNSLMDDLYGVTNQYLEQCLQELGIKDIKVEGKVEEMKVCPCCDYLTHKDRKGFDVCKLCHWEYTGKDLDLYSGPNRMTLREGRAQFKSKGVSSTKWHYQPHKV